MNKELALRLEIAKRFIAEAKEATANDSFEEARAILHIHDALELVLASAVVEMDCDVKSSDKLFDYLDQLNSKLPDAQRIPGKPLIKKINSVRNSLKHEGILPRSESTQGLIIEIEVLANKVCAAAFEVDLESISLSSLIKNESSRELYLKAEEAFRKGAFKGCLETLSLLAYNEIEQSYQPPIQPWHPGLGSFSAPDARETDFAVHLLKYGVSPFLFQRFKLLTPTIRMDGTSTKSTLEWGKNFGHDKNWTKENARFCLNFLADAVLSLQDAGSTGSQMSHYLEHYADKIVIATDGANLTTHSHSSFAANSQGLYTLIPNLAELRLKKDSVYYGIVHEVSEYPEEYLVQFITNPSESKKSTDNIWYALKKDIHWERVSVETAKEALAKLKDQP